MSVKRRDLIKTLSIGGGAGFICGGIATKLLTEKSQQPNIKTGHEYETGPGSVLQQSLDPYGSMSHPPSGVKADFLDKVTIPPAPLSHITEAQHKEYQFTVIEETLAVAMDTPVDAWTYNGNVPAPIIRANSGDKLTFHFYNPTEHPHNLHFHGSHDVNYDGWEAIPAGGRTTYHITAGPAGLFPYHCHVAPIATHIAKGMFGTLIVDPEGGRPPAHEFNLVLNGWDLKEQKKNDLYCWNGIAGFYHRFPIKVPVGERVRLYVTNMVEYEPLASFHLHAQTFDVYRSGTSLTPDEHTDVITLGQTERAILEFTLPKRGRYMFHPHQSHMAEAGAMGWIVAI